MCGGCDARIERLAVVDLEAKLEAARLNVATQHDDQLHAISRRKPGVRPRTWLGSAQLASSGRKLPRVLRRSRLKPTHLNGSMRCK